ncbi:hypothetical protein FQN54_000944 [Arachnomyces sp. PD_36]|nr:hypothetical protein FQN54_000944 [Arachnomyces sp. PD_36]
MASVSLLAFAALITALIIKSSISFARNLRKAKASGITYVIVPVYLYHRFWLVTHKIWLIGLRKLPASWTHSWIHFVDPDWTWSHRYEPFHRLGTDTILTVSPGGCVMWTVDPSVISQIASRRNDFPKPTALYTSLDVYGKNIITTEGEQWRLHRKITSPPFAEKNNVLVWQETVYQAQKMLVSWLGEDGGGNRTVHRLMDDTLRLSLYIISKAGFGVRLQWPETGEERETRLEPSKENLNDPIKIRNEGYSETHTMSYMYSLYVVLEHIIIVMLVPHWILKNSPFKVMRRAHEAYVEWGKYMKEMVVTKKAEINSGKESADLLSALVHGAGLSDDIQTQTGASKHGVYGSPNSSLSQGFTEKGVLGNAFAFILAGHETTGNSMHFVLISLALKLQSQRHLQRDIESVLGNRPPEEWSYDHDLPKLFGGMTGAVLHEQLRLVPPVTNIPKTVLGEDQRLLIDGEKVTVPAQTSIGLISTGAHRNPKYWPHGPPSDAGNPWHPICNLDNDLEEFRPERWLPDENGKYTGVDVEGTKISGPSITDANPPDSTIQTAEEDVPYSSLFHPPRGAYIPFSDGHRSCLGRRFGQIEILAVLAVIFSRHSVELAVDDFATDEEVDRMTMAERKQVWDKAAHRATDLLNNSLTQIITLKMSNHHVPLRFVKKGEERFNFS